METFTPCASRAVQDCSCCAGSSGAAPTEVNQNHPDLDLLDAETWSSGCQRRPEEDPTDAAVISCHVAPAASSTQTQAAINQRSL